MADAQLTLVLDNTKFNEGLVASTKALQDLQSLDGKITLKVEGDTESIGKTRRVLQGIIDDDNHGLHIKLQALSDRDSIPTAQAALQTLANAQAIGINLQAVALNSSIGEAQRQLQQYTTNIRTSLQAVADLDSLRFALGQFALNLPTFYTIGVHLSDVDFTNTRAQLADARLGVVITPDIPQALIDEELRLAQAVLNSRSLQVGLRFTDLPNRIAAIRDFIVQAFAAIPITLSPIEAQVETRRHQLVTALTQPLPITLADITQQIATLQATLQAPLTIPITLAPNTEALRTQVQTALTTPPISAPIDAKFKDDALANRRREFTANIKELVGLVDVKLADSRAPRDIRTAVEAALNQPRVQLEIDVEAAFINNVNTARLNAAANFRENPIAARITPELFGLSDVRTAVNNFFAEPLRIPFIFTGIVTRLAELRRQAENYFRTQNLLIPVTATLINLGTLQAEIAQLPPTPIAVAPAASAAALATASSNITAHYAANPIPVSGSIIVTNPQVVKALQPVELPVNLKVEALQGVQSFATSLGLAADSADRISAALKNIPTDALKAVTAKADKVSRPEATARVDQVVGQLSFDPQIQSTIKFQDTLRQLKTRLVDTVTSTGIEAQALRNQLSSILSGSTDAGILGSGVVQALTSIKNLSTDVNVRFGDLRGAAQGAAVEVDSLALKTAKLEASIASQAQALGLDDAAFETFKDDVNSGNRALQDLDATQLKLVESLNKLTKARAEANKVQPVTQNLQSAALLKATQPTPTKLSVEDNAKFDAAFIKLDEIAKETNLDVTKLIDALAKARKGADLFGEGIESNVAGPLRVIANLLNKDEQALRDVSAATELAASSDNKLALALAKRNEAARQIVAAGKLTETQIEKVTRLVETQDVGVRLLTTDERKYAEALYAVAAAQKAVADAPKQDAVDRARVVNPELRKNIKTDLLNTFKNLEGAQLAKVAAAADKVAAAFNNAGASAAEAADAIANFKSGNIQAIPAHLQKVVEGLNNFQATGVKATTKVKTAFNDLSVLQATLASNLLSRAITFSVTEFSQSLRAAIDFQKRISEIRTITQDSSNTFAQFAQQVKVLSSELGAPAVAVAEGVYQALSNQVVKTADSFTFLRTAIQLGQTTVASTDQSVNALSSVINGFGLSSAQAEHIAAVLFKTVELGRLRLSELGDGLGRVSTAARSLGVSFEETAAAVQTLTIQGFKPQESLTIINSLMTQLTKPTKEMKELFTDLGVASGEAAIATFGFAGFLKILDDESERGSTRVKELLGDVRALRAGLGLTGPAFANFNSNLRKTREESEATFDTAKKIAQESPGFRLSKEIISITNEFTSLGQNIIGVLDTINTTVGGLGLRMRQAFDITAAATKATGIVLGLVGAWKAYVAIQALVTASTAGTSLALTVAGSSAAGAISKLVIGLSAANPVMLGLVAATAAVTVAIRAYGTEADRLREAEEARLVFSAKLQEDTAKREVSLNKLIEREKEYTATVLKIIAANNVRADKEQQIANLQEEIADITTKRTVGSLLKILDEAAQKRIRAIEEGFAEEGKATTKRNRADNEAAFERAKEQIELEKVRLEGLKKERDKANSEAIANEAKLTENLKATYDTRIHDVETIIERLSNARAEFLKTAKEGKALIKELSLPVNIDFKIAQAKDKRTPLKQFQDSLRNVNPEITRLQDEGTKLFSIGNIDAGREAFKAAAALALDVQEQGLSLLKEGKTTEEQVRAAAEGVLSVKQRQIQLEQQQVKLAEERAALAAEEENKRRQQLVILRDATKEVIKFSVFDNQGKLKFGSIEEAQKALSAKLDAVDRASELLPVDTSLDKFLQLEDIKRRTQEEFRKQTEAFRPQELVTGGQISSGAKGERDQPTVTRTLGLAGTLFERASQSTNDAAQDFAESAQLIKTEIQAIINKIGGNLEAAKDSINAASEFKNARDNIKAALELANKSILEGKKKGQDVSALEAQRDKIFATSSALEAKIARQNQLNIASNNIKLIGEASKSAEIKDLTNKLLKLSDDVKDAKGNIRSEFEIRRNNLGTGDLDKNAFINKGETLIDSVSKKLGDLAIPDKAIIEQLRDALKRQAEVLEIGIAKSKRDAEGRAVKTTADEINAKRAELSKEVASTSTEIDQLKAKLIELGSPIDKLRDRFTNSLIAQAFADTAGPKAEDVLKGLSKNTTGSLFEAAKLIPGQEDVAILLQKLSRLEKIKAADLEALNLSLTPDGFKTNSEGSLLVEDKTLVETLKALLKTQAEQTAPILQREANRNQQQQQQLGFDPNAIPKAAEAIKSVPAELSAANEAIRIRVKAESDAALNDALRKARKGFATGGIVDTVPAMLTPGEFVINPEATRQNRSLLEYINAQRFDVGGLVRGSSASGGTNITNSNSTFNVSVLGQETPRATAVEIGRALQREVRRGTVRLK